MSVWDFTPFTFTDLTQTDPRYFWMRGALWGLVAATLVWRVVVPWLWRRM